MDIFGQIESNVSFYCTCFNDVFTNASNDKLYTNKGKEYIDFLSGAGALNYGHNNPYIKDYVLEYLKGNGIIQGLDFYSTVKGEFLESFKKKILDKKGLDYKIQFCGPTGTNANEAALKLAQKYTNRNSIFSFMGGYHGMTQGSMSVTSRIKEKYNSNKNVVFIPTYINGCDNYDPVRYIRQIIEDDHSGCDLPAAIIFETIQAEGGVKIFSCDILKSLRKLCDEYEILMICDDIQVGCYRTGTFFSFEEAGIQPDIVSLSKSISGLGLPMSILLIKSKFDVWKPGEHNGTFRGNQLAFVGAKAALEWAENNNIENIVTVKEKIVRDYLNTKIRPIDKKILVRGKGLIWGIDLSAFGMANIGKQISRECYKDGLIVENVGKGGNIIKILPALTVGKENLIKGLEIIGKNVEILLSEKI